MSVEIVAITGWEIDILNSALETLRKEFDVNPVPSVIVDNPDLVPYKDHQQQINGSMIFVLRNLARLRGSKPKLNAPHQDNQSAREFTITSDEEQVLVSSVLRLITQRPGVIFVDGRWLRTKGKNSRLRAASRQRS